VDFPLLVFNRVHSCIQLESAPILIYNCVGYVNAEHLERTSPTYVILHIAENERERNAMEKFKLQIIETLSRVVEVEADTYERACEKLEDDYKHQRIVLDENDFVEFEIFPY